MALISMVVLALAATVTMFNAYNTWRLMRGCPLLFKCADGSWTWEKNTMPTPPKNARLVQRDTGQTVLLELVYRGKEDGLHHWAAVTTMNPALLRPEWWALEIEELPAKTSISIEFEDGYYPAKKGPQWRGTK